MHAGMVGKAAIEALARVPAQVEIASEFRYRNPILRPEDLVIIISQSGETSDTLAALKLAKSRGVPVLAIVNVVGSSIARAADYVMYTYAGPEIAVASTKAYMVQMCVLYLFALRLAYARGMQTDAEIRRLTAELLRDGRKISINCTGVEDALDVTMAQRSELDYLIYNDPLGYADLILNGNPEEYLKNVTGNHGLED